MEAFSAVTRKHLLQAAEVFLPMRLRQTGELPAAYCRHFEKAFYQALYFMRRLYDQPKKRRFAPVFKPSAQYHQCIPYNTNYLSTKSTLCL